MQYPAQIAAENQMTGIRALVYRYTEPTVRIHAESVLICGLKGNMEAESAGSHAEIGAGTLYFVSAGKEIRFLPKTEKAEAAYVLLIFIPDTALEDSPARIMLNSSGEEESEAYDEVLRLLTQLTALPQASDTYYEVHRKACWQQLVYELLSRFQVPGLSGGRGSRKDIGKADRTPEAFREILNFIELNYQEEIQLNDLAKTFFYTPSHLSKQFSKYTGMKFTEYLTGLRLTKAMPLLLQSSMEITQISDRCGFPNERAFQQAFQKKYQVRPSVYRKNFTDTETGVKREEMLENLKVLHEDGLFEKLADRAGRNDGKAVKEREQRTEVAVPVIRRNAGSFDISETTPCAVAGKNNILHIDFCRDLLIDTIRDQVRMLQKNMHYEYIVLNGFISDDLQIYFSDTLNPDFSEKSREDRVLRYDFSMYVKILEFVKELGLKPIIPLSYIPSFLARGQESFDTLYHSCIDMPYNMNEWERYLTQLLNTLHVELGEWVENGRIFLWNTPDIQIMRTRRITADEYFELYSHTWQVIRRCLPGISIDSPTITCTADGLEFCRNYLQYCRVNDCLPEQLLFTYYKRSANGFRFLSPFQECNSFFNNVEEMLKGMKLSKQISLCAFEYSVMFGRNPVCDALPSAMLPVTFTLNTPDRFNGFGLYRGPELSTRTYTAGNMFTGIYSLLTKSGGRKASFHALRFLSELGDECIAAEPGLYVTRKENRIQILMYYDIPQNEWKREFTAENPEVFYGDFPEMEFAVTLDRMELLRKGQELKYSLLIREQIVNSEAGSAYEEWIAEGCGLEERMSGADSDIVPRRFRADGSPKVRTRIQENTGNSEAAYTYQCRLKPFEIRFTELVPVNKE